MCKMSMPTERNNDLEEYYMRQALQVARAALDVGEVPVGCVLVLRDPEECQSSDTKSNKDHNRAVVKERSTGGSQCQFLNHPSVIVSHGANQVNATRDATRHAEIVAIDRMLTGGKSSDHLRLPPTAMAASAHGRIPKDSPLLNKADSSGDNCVSATINGWNDAWVNAPMDTDSNHWKNTYGWGSGRMYEPTIFQRCDLYVTCEPCIMCAAALAKVGIGRVFFGCHNTKFGGCGSLMNLHEETALPSPEHHGYPIIDGVLKEEAIALLRSFYDRENFHAPDDKRKRKEMAEKANSTSEEVSSQKKLVIAEEATDSKSGKASSSSKE